MKKNKNITILPTSKSTDNIPISFILLYLLLSSLILYWGKPHQKTSQTHNQYFFTAIALGLGLYAFSGTLYLSGEVKWQHLQNIDLWKTLMCSVFFYFVIFLTSHMYAKKIRTLSSGAIFLGMFFLFYFLNLMNWLTLKIADGIFLNICLITFLGLAFLKSKKTPAYINLDIKDFLKLDVSKFLIILWLLHSLLYFFTHNFTPARSLITDEYNLWGSAAINMIEGSFPSAHMALYSGNGLHAFGIPFSMALPSVVLGNKLTHSIFFMPLINIFSLLLFLIYLHKKSPWGFLFFYGALFLSINTQNWLSELCYSLIYSEGIFLIYFLYIIYEVFEFIQNKEFDQRHFIVLNIFIALFALTRSPGNFVSWLFFPILFVYMIKQLHFSKKRIVLNVFLSASILTIPYETWKYASIHFPFSSHSLSFIRSNAFHFLDINTGMIEKVIGQTYTFYHDIFLFIIVSFVLFLYAFPKRLYLILLPIILLYTSVFYFYGYAYNGGDYISSTRYLTPPLLALYYLGARGAGELMKGFE